MKIVFLHQTLGLVNRGSEISTRLIASALSKNHDVTVIQSGRAKTEKYHVEVVAPLKTPPPVTPINFLDKVLSRVALDKRSRMVCDFTVDCLPAIRQLKPDVIVATNGATQIRVLSSSGIKAKIVVFGRAGMGFDDRENLRAAPDLFIALSSQALTWARAYQRHKTKLVYLPNPIDLTAYKKIQPFKLDLPRPIVLTVGALSAYKNILEVVRATKPMNVSLVIVGDGEQAHELQSELSTYPGDFRWLRAVEPSDLPAIYKAADAFCFLPDPQEAFGRVYLEAMAANLPIVASDDPIRRNIVGDKGFFVDPHNPESIREKLILAVNKPHPSYKSELEEYSLDKVMAKLEKEFHDLIN